MARQKENHSLSSPSLSRLGDHFHDWLEAWRSELLEGHGSRERCRNHGAASDHVPKSDIHHLSAIAGLAPVDETICVVTFRKRNFRRFVAKKVAQRLPAGANLVLEQTLLGNKLAQLGVVVDEALFASVLKVTVEEAVPELAQHGIVEVRGPVEVGEPTEFRVVGAPINGLHDGSSEQYQSHMLQVKVWPETYACHESTSLVVTMTLASGYASISSLAKATAGQSQIA